MHIYTVASDLHMYASTSPDGGVTWSGWEDLGGDLAGEVAAVKPAPGGIEIVARSTDGSVWKKTWAAGTGYWPSQTGWDGLEGA